MRVTGEIVEYERRNWDMNREDGSRASGTLRLAKVQESRSSIVDVRYPDSLPEPREGDQVDLLVQVRTAYGKSTVHVTGAYEGYTTPAGGEFPAQAGGGEAIAARSNLAAV